MGMIISAICLFAVLVIAWSVLPASTPNESLSNDSMSVAPTTSQHKAHQA